MHESPTTSLLPRPTAEQSRAAVVRARRLFHYALQGWACDLLVLRRGGFDLPAWRTQPDESSLSRAA